MRRLPWHVALRADRKGVLTALGIALGVAFAIVSFGVPAALQTEAVSPEGPLAHQDALVTLPGGDALDAGALGVANRTLVLLANVTLDDGRELRLVALDGPDAPALADGEIFPGRLASGAPPTVTLGNLTLHVADPTSDARVPADRYLAPVAVVRAADARLAAPTSASYVLAHGLTASDADALRARGYRVSFVPGIEPFFQASVTEISRDLLLVVAFTSTLVALFAYEFLRSEAREKRAEIGLWRSVGMRAQDVLALLLARSLALVAGGIVLGASLALLALVGAARATHAGVYAWQISPATLAALCAAFLAAGALGALVPALAVARAPVREQLEAAA